MCDDRLIVELLSKIVFQNFADMRTLFVLCVITLAVNANPVKRFAGVGVSSAVSGGVGCVVTGNKFFANGLYMRDLNPEEQRELAEYEKEVKAYKEEVKSIVEERQRQMKDRNSKSVTRKDLKLEIPDPPKKPSFCADIDTTQYYFPGCMVQNNKVYVGTEYARDLTPKEIDELKVFDAKMSKYQKYISSALQQQFKGLFGGNDFWALFTDRTTTPPPSTTSIAPVEAPETPNFCTAIY
ncbi:hypothetical protein AB6A40_005073 [Gnathostoma spinigerum]|uniref:Pepsin inhibitor-3-like repeated domain-containing protein n=1 Tax=Gnathostoma spinigerum TaxID=75299 RepID=A0ABD6EM20_9BILA